MQEVTDPTSWVLYRDGGQRNITPGLCSRSDGSIETGPESKSVSRCISMPLEFLANHLDTYLSKYLPGYIMKGDDGLSGLAYVASVSEEPCGF